MNKSNSNTFLTSINQNFQIKKDKKQNKLNEKDNYNNIRSKSKEEKIKDNLIDYLIKEKLQFIDMKKIEEYYQENSMNLYKKYNKNLLTIKRKKEEERKLNHKFNLLLMENVTYPNTLNNYYDELIKITKRNILIKKHQFDCYNHVYRRTYTINYLMSKRLDDEREYYKIYNEQNEKYSVLDKHSIQVLKKQEKLLSEMKTFDDRIQLGYENKIAENTKILNQLDFEVFLLKKETKEIEKELEIIKLRQKKLKKQILKNEIVIKNKYNSYLEDWRIFQYSNIKIFKIYNILNVKNFMDVIKEFKKIQKKYNELSSLFTLHNKEINYLQTNISELNREYKKALSIIYNKKNNKKEKNELNELNQFIMSKLSKIKFSNQIILENYKDKSKTLKLIVNFLLKNIESMINSLNNLSLKNYFTFNSNFKPQFSEKFLEHNTFSFNKDIDTIKLNSDFIKFIISVFNNFSKYFYLILSSSCNIIYYSHLLKISKGNSNYSINYKELMNKNKRNLKGENNFIIYEINSEPLIETFNDEILLSNLRQIEKQKILGRTEKDIFKSKFKFNKNIKSYSSINILKGNNNTNMENSFVSRNTILKDYENYLKGKIPNLGNYVEEHENSHLSLIKKFSNNLVSLRDELKDLNRKKEISNKTLQIKNYNYQKQFANYIKKKQNYIEISNFEDDDELSENEIEYCKNLQKKKFEEEIQESKKTKQYIMSSNNPEMILIYKRLNDLRKLNLHFVKDRSKYILDHDAFNYIYFNFKNKLLNKSRIKIEKNRLSKTPSYANFFQNNIFLNKRDNKITNNNSFINIKAKNNSIYSKYKLNSNSYSNILPSTSRTGRISFNNSTRNNVINIEKIRKTIKNKTLINYHKSNILDNDSNINNNSSNLNFSKNTYEI